MFEAECFSKSLLGRVIDSLVDGDCCRFVTGADIEKIVNISLRKIWSLTGLNNMITASDWEKALRESMSVSSVYGEGWENLDSIAMCYLKLLRNNFKSVSSDSNFLFKNSDYHIEYDKDGNVRDAGFDRKNEYLNEMSLYDQKRYEVLFERINRLAKHYEINNQHNSIR